MKKINSNEPNETIVLRVVAAIFFVSITTFILFSIIDFKPKFFMLNSFSLINLLKWIFIFVLIFCIIYSFYFVRQLSQILRACFEINDFFILDIVISFIVTIMIYLLQFAHSKNLTQFSVLIFIDLYAVYVLIFPKRTFLIINKIIILIKKYKFLEFLRECIHDYIKSITLGNIFNIFLYIFSPFNVIAGLLTLIIKYKVPANDYELYIFIIPIILLVSLMGEIIVEIILGQLGYAYIPTGISKIFRKIIFAIIFERILKPLVVQVISSISSTPIPFTISSIIQSVVTYQIWFKEELSLIQRIIFSLISLSIFSTFLYFLKPGRILKLSAIILGALSYQISLIIITFIASAIFLLIQHIIYIRPKEEGSVGFLIIFFSILLIIYI
jgi:hypothetical protein